MIIIIEATCKIKLKISLHYSQCKLTLVIIVLKNHNKHKLLFEISKVLMGF